MPAFVAFSIIGEIHSVDPGYNIVSMPRPEDLKNAAE
jgi:hypothetical protein